MVPYLSYLSYNQLFIEIMAKNISQTDWTTLRGETFYAEEEKSLEELGS